MSEPDLTRMPEPGYPKASGPIPSTVLTNKPGPAAGTGRTTLLLEAGTATIAVAEAY